MTHAVRQARPVSRDHSDSSAPRRVVTHVTGALDGVMRVVTVLRARGYVVRDLSVDVREELHSELRATVVVTAQQADLLLERLRRLAVVVDALAEDL
ncbi:hypothetical protein ACFY1L_52790 [Streptomyces sp. NPDC001663]|uniref:hypothetical protein n=1 Tax=Streptomyces sp. NPDC001663 TaxID=3364597 RepID=UPI0036AD844A